MHYEINVAYNGRHLFATHERSLTDKESALSLFNKFVQIFPVSQGYEISLTQENRSRATLVESKKA